jgi:hypothetical protein
MVCPKGVHVQDVSILVLMPKSYQGFTNVVDVVVDYIYHGLVWENTLKK